MPNPSPHVDLGGYVLGKLEPSERARFEEHLAECATCQEELAALADVAEVLPRAAPAFELPRNLQAKTFMAIERAAAADEAAEAEAPHSEAPRRRWTWPRQLGLVAVTVGTLAAGVFVGSQFDRVRDEEPLEAQAVLATPDGAGQATADVVKTGIGRVIEFRTDDLPILPKAEFYELWFVGPGDSPANPNRISAGTFHPDENGRSHVTFAAAVDPKKYPVLSVTAEPGDGNPQRTGPEVLRSEST